MNNISFATTATCRPDILRQTYSSFAKHLRDISLKNCRLYINIDPLPSPSLSIQTLEVAQEFFDDIVVNMPEEANFTAAVDWLWNSAESDYLFLLEDDWILNCGLHMSHVMSMFDSADIQQVVLRAYNYTYRKLVLSPSVMKKECYKHFAGKFNYSINPEVQLRDKAKFNSSNIKCIGRDPIVSDIGRAWLSKQGFNRGSEKSAFNQWFKSN